MPSDKVLQQLQETLLGAVLLGRTLPGSSAPVRLPDLSFVMRHPETYLLDANLSGPVSVLDSPRPVRIVSIDVLRRESLVSGDISYLQFQPPEVTGETVGLTLEARIVARDPKQQALGLSNIHVKFARVEGEWRVVDAPVYSAA